MIKVADVFGSPLDLLKKTRSYLLSCRENAPEDVLTGLNYNIIINTALIFEAEAENLLHNILDQYERLYIEFYQPDLIGVDKKLAANAKSISKSILPKIKEYSSRGTGIDHYIKMFKFLIPEEDLNAVTPFTEGIQVLFQFRNVIAHGRAIRFEERMYYDCPDYENEVRTEIDFMGGYRKIQDYLIKQKLLDKPITETHDVTSLFSNKVCDHLIEMESKYMAAMEKCVPFEMLDYKDDYEKI